MLLILLVNPLHDFPLSDDWEYARTAQTLLTTGQFYRSPIVQATALFPALWGALFSALLGLSFTALRLSTLPLGLGTALAFYAILGELEFDPLPRTLGALTLVAGPLFMLYTNSFMTDIPFLFWLLLGLWLSLRAFRLAQPALLATGSLCAALAFLTRQLGLALPAAVSLAVLLYRPRGDRLRWLAAALPIPFAAAGLFYVWQSLAGQATWADSTITGSTLAFLLQTDTIPAAGRRMVDIGVTVNLYLFPLWLAFLPRALPSLWRSVRLLDRPRQALVGLAALYLFGTVLYLGARGEWWPYHLDSLTRAGLRPFLAHFAWPNDIRPAFLPSPVWSALTLAGTGLSLLLVALGVTARLGRPLDASPPTRAGYLPRAPLGLVYLTTLTLLAANLSFPLFFERYIFQFLPGAIVLLLELARPSRPGRPIFALCWLALAAFSVSLMWDYFDWHAVRWSESQALVRQGVPLEKLDAGFEWSGWYLSDESYVFIRAHNLPLTTTPWEYVLDPEYMMTFTPLPGYRVERELPFSTPFRPGGRDKILLLKRQAPP